MFCVVGIKLHFYEAIEVGSVSASRRMTALAGVGPSPAGGIGP